MLVAAATSSRAEHTVERAAVASDDPSPGQMPRDHWASIKRSMGGCGHEERSGGDSWRRRWSVHSIADLTDRQWPRFWPVRSEPAPDWRRSPRAAASARPLGLHIVAAHKSCHFFDEVVAIRIAAADAAAAFFSSVGGQKVTRGRRRRDGDLRNHHHKLCRRQSDPWV